MVQNLRVRYILNIFKDLYENLKNAKTDHGLEILIFV